MKTKWRSVLSLLFVFSLFSAGCLYPQENRQQLDQLDKHVYRVQNAVEQYQHDQKVLPYKYTEEDEKLTTKYMVDFRQLGGYVGQIPPSAFEMGGNFLYVLINVEKKPTVRLFDLRVNELVDSVQKQVSAWMKKHGSLPAGQQVAPGIFEIDFRKLEIDPVTVPSPYSSDTELSLVMDQKGRVYVDYRTEVMKKLQSSGKKPEFGRDLRYWLAEDSLFVPAFSPPMKFSGNDPVFDLSMSKSN